MVSPVGRDTPREDTSTPRKMLPPPTTTAISTPSFARRDQVAGDAVDGRLVDAEGLAAGEIFAGQLDDDAPVDRLSHAAIAPLRARQRFGAHAADGACASAYFLPLAAATSAAKSDSCFSIPSPRA